MPRGVEITVNPKVIEWAIYNSDYDMDYLYQNVKNLKDWLSGEKKPTLLQLGNFSKKINIPFGYMLLKEPPDDLLSETIAVNDAETLFKEYNDWVLSNTEFRQAGEWVEITTGFLDIHNDVIQIYLKKEENQYILSDDGFVKSELHLSGLNLNTQKQKELYNSVMKRFGVYEENDTLYKMCSENEFPFHFQRFLQAIIYISALSDARIKEIVSS